MKDFKILIVDDEYEYQEVFKMILEEKGYTVKTCGSAEEALKISEKENFHLILTDLKMEHMGGLALLEEIKKREEKIEVILVTGYGTIESAVEAMKKGAFSYFIKSHNPEALLIEIEKLLKMKRLEADNNIFRNQQKREEFLLSSKNKGFTDILDVATKAANSNVSVLILGESGTGKEVLARYIHQVSKRNKGHFVAVNCQVFSEGLLESELFGHEKGAFTGALEKRIGRFEEANEGTLFLDEIGEMPTSTQIKLLRAIETKSVERIGNNRSISIDLRLISATNRNIPIEIKKGTFREDLFYRINTITIEMPPLRERKEDLPLLIDFFFNRTQKELKKKILKVENGIHEFLLDYHYPGNIRELKNIIERLVVLSEDGIIKVNDLSVGKNQLHKKEDQNFQMKLLRDARKEFEMNYIRQVLNKCGGRITEASKHLGITRRQLSNKVVEYSLKKELKRK
ncbi:sigma-54 dependent transcriptional regulator [Clostridiaceae bacterium 35-E11]